MYYLPQQSNSPVMKWEISSQQALAGLSLGLVAYRSCNPTVRIHTKMWYCVHISAGRNVTKE